MSDQRDLFGPGTQQGWVEAVKGMNRAIEHANRVSTEDEEFKAIWHYLAREVFYRFVMKFPVREKVFYCEDIRNWIKEAGIPFLDPPDNRSWGHVMKSASSADLTEGQGYGKAKNPNVHMNAQMGWLFIGTKEQARLWMKEKYEPIKAFCFN